MPRLGIKSRLRRVADVRFHDLIIQTTPIQKLSGLVRTRNYLDFILEKTKYARLHLVPDGSPPVTSHLPQTME